MSNCQGCGALFQTTHPKHPGYRLDETHTLCVRCFQLRHYNRPFELEEAAVLRVIPSDALGVVILDLFDLEVAFLSRLPRYFSGEFILVVNKVDLFPDSMNPSKTKEYLRRLSREYGLKPLDVQVVSAKSGDGVDELIDTLNRFIHDEIYLIGPTNSGKSSLLNQLLRRLDVVHEVTVSPFANTTLDHIGIQLDKVMMYDTPGLTRDRHIHHYLSTSLKDIIPTKQIKPQTIQLTKPGVIYLGGFARLDFDHTNGVSFFVAPKIVLHKTTLEKADSFFQTHQFTTLLHPSVEEVSLLGAWVFDTIRVESDEDLVIEGLGFVRIAVTATVIIHHYANVEVYVRPSVFRRASNGNKTPR
jgi:ribosome biogenesis GTPase YqeH